MGKRKGAYRVLVMNREARRPIGRPRRRKEDNIKMNIRAVGWGIWIGSILLWIRRGGWLL
jgi:hypothetical protein